MRQGGLNINEIMRAQYISRWTIVATTRPQSLAEHTFNVTMLVRDWCYIVGEDDVLMMKAAMEHDLDEVLTGDIPTPAKVLMRDNDFEPSSIEGYQKNCSRLSISQGIVLKAIDILESIHYLDNFGTGNRAKQVRELLYNQFLSTVDRLLDKREWFEALHDLSAEILENWGES